MTEIGEIIDVNGEARRVIARTAMIWEVRDKDGKMREEVLSYALKTESVERD